MGDVTVLLERAHGGDVDARNELFASLYAELSRLAGQKLAREVTAAGPGEAVFIRCDVSRTDEVERLVDDTVARFGRLDCLVNNAGWHPPHQPIDAFTPADFRSLFELNVMSVFVACRRALPHLRKTRGNIVLNSGSSRIGRKDSSGPV